MAAMARQASPPASPGNAADAETSQQHVLRRPSSDSAQFEQPGADLVVVSMYQPFEADSASLNGASQHQQGADFLQLKPIA